MIPNFYSVIADDADKTTNFKQALVDLLDSIMNEAGITDTVQLQTLARLRARVEIDLKDF